MGSGPDFINWDWNIQQVYSGPTSGLMVDKSPLFVYLWLNDTLVW